MLHMIPFVLMRTDGNGGYHRTCHVFGIFRTGTVLKSQPFRDLAGGTNAENTRRL